MIFKTLPRDILRLGAIIERQSAETTPGEGVQVEVRNIIDSVIKSNFNLSFQNSYISKVASSAVMNLYLCKKKENETECKQTVSNTNEN